MDDLAEEKRNGVDLPPLKTGDRLWTWLEDDPSPLEECITEAIVQSIGGLGQSSSESNLFFLRVFSWKASGSDAFQSFKSEIPTQVKLPENRWVNLFQNSRVLDGKIPYSTLSYFQEPHLGGQDIQISARNVKLQPGSYVLLFATQESVDNARHNLSSGLFDVLGVSSLLAGGQLLRNEVFSSYFCTERTKFVCSDIEVKKGFSEFYSQIRIKTRGLDELDAENNSNLHACLWFVGRAYTSKSSTERIVFYNAALEAVVGSNRFENFFRKIYRPVPGLIDAVVCKIKEIKNLRDNLLHDGIVNKLTENTERFVHALLVDAIVYTETGTLPFPAAKELLEDLESNNT